MDIVGINLIALLGRPDRGLVGLERIGKIFQDEDLAGLLVQPAMTQGFGIDPGSPTAVPTVQGESMRSQRMVTVTPNRIEVHDLSGSSGRTDELVRLMELLIKAYAIEEIQKCGSNFVAIGKMQTNASAAGAIYGTLLRHDPLFAEGATIIGGGVRWFLSREDLHFNVAVEPRANLPDAADVWISCNSEMDVTHLPDSSQMKRMVRVNEELVAHLFEEVTHHA